MFLCYPFPLSSLLLLLLLLSTVYSLTMKSSCKISTASSFSTRVELFFKNPSDLKDRIRFLQSEGISCFNIVNKDKKDTMDVWINSIREVYPESNICAHYSLKYNKVPRKGIAEQRDQLLNDLEEDYCNADEILLISGSGKKTTQWNMIEALKAVKDIKSTSAESSSKSKPKISVAYNPYFPSPSDQEEENRRLEEKLATGCVSKIYLQFGTDLNSLKNGIEFCYNKVKEENYNDISIAGSLFLPTKQLIAQQKFRPWNGVFLSQEFLSGPEHAAAIVSEMIKIYIKNNIELLWEAPGIRTEKDMGVVYDIMERAVGSKDDEIIDIASSTLIGGKETLSSSTTGTSSSDIDISATKRPKLMVHNARSSLEKKKISRSNEPCLLIFGTHDVRLQDNKAVEEATRRHKKVLPVFLWTKEDSDGMWSTRGAIAVCLQDALYSLETSLQSFDLHLECRLCTNTDDGPEHGVTEIRDLINKVGAKAVFWNKEFTPEGRKREAVRKDFLIKSGVQVYETQSSLLYDPDKIELSSDFDGGHFATLMPFFNSCKKNFGSPPRPMPHVDTFRLLEGTLLPTNTDSKSTSTVNDLNIVKVTGNHKWDEPIRKRFPMSEKAANDAMEIFVRNGMKKYEKERSRADKDGATSQLSPHLRIGTLSPNQLYWRIEDSGLSPKTFSRRLIWRDLAYYQLSVFPDMRTRCIRSHYEHTEWVDGSDEEDRRFQAWKTGMTGFPIVDAGMRELYATGWMTQSIRMVVASFLVEYLRVNWTKGCEWFHYTLVDADSAINAMMWQNAGKSGIDQWNFVSSPTTASQDSTGAYTQRWVPELADLPTSALMHRPWEGSRDVLLQAGVVLGDTYPHRIVIDLKAERQLSVDSTLSMRRKSQEYNNSRGYDLIQLPNGSKTIVFTKKEYRINENGGILKNDPTIVRRKATTRRKRK